MPESVVYPPAKGTYVYTPPPTHVVVPLEGGGFIRKRRLLGFPFRLRRDVTGGSAPNPTEATDANGQHGERVTGGSAPNPTEATDGNANGRTSDGSR